MDLEESGLGHAQVLAFLLHIILHEEQFLSIEDVGHQWLSREMVYFVGDGVAELAADAAELGLQLRSVDGLVVGVLHPM